MLKLNSMNSVAITLTQLSTHAGQTLPYFLRVLILMFKQDGNSFTICDTGLPHCCLPKLYPLSPACRPC